ncbi:MAG: valine--tRNA ligase [Pseudomonadota bacterium]|nr:valine--tRNA ligase [Pseudomonadota bacterium]
MAKTQSLSDNYSPNEIEQKLYPFWHKMNVGRPSGTGQPYSISLPPPNVTGALHLGHALQHAIMDTIARQKRSEGYRVLLQPGTDHAGIATQMVVERQLNAQGIDKNDLTREEIIKKIWEWKQTSGDRIGQQMLEMGVSADWDHDRFTLDEDFSKSVLHAFMTLYEKGYIYRGKRLVNWDTKLKTAVSDLEVVNEERQGQIWFIHYKLAHDENQTITVATTRPETLFGDMAICVNPDDERFSELVGQSAIIPICNRHIPIIADDAVDPEFGTGCLKITPAHDFNDYDIGKRHQLDALNILNNDGTLNENCPEAFQNLDRFIARKKVLKTLETLHQLERVEPHTANVPIGDRSNTILEPYLTNQWYIKMKGLAADALKAIEDEHLEFVPENWKSYYQMWLNDIQDWCISRQLWWGHRIPAFYDDNGKFYVGASEQAVRDKYHIVGNLTQDEDVLDTWFSSALWPFATQGWPQNTERFTEFYPNSLLVTGFDIIFFWVARMCMFGQLFTQQMPFPKVYVTGLIRDEFGQKMSKSKGNVLDPTDLIKGATLDELIHKRTQGMMQPKMKEAAIKATKTSFPNGVEAHGTDALRFTLLALSTHTKDINFDLNKLRASRNFCNKIWNADRFLSQEANPKSSYESTITQALSHQLNQLIHQCHTHLSTYRFDRYAQALYEFFWNEFCDWHLELAKVNSESGPNTERMGHLYQVFEPILIILHPALPFITEALWQKRHGDSQSITSESTPSAEQFPSNPEAFSTFTALKTLISGIRNIRSELSISPKALLTLYCDYDHQAILSQFTPEIKKLGGISDIVMTDTLPANLCNYVHSEISIGIDLTGHIDITQEKQRLEKRIAKIQKELDKVTNKMANPKYQEKAPDALKAKDLATSEGLQNNINQLEKYLKAISHL